jgi:signal transduction histidine kinase
MICKQKRALLKPWREGQWQLLMFLTLSIGVALLVILGVSTYLVGRIYEADQKRVATLHEIEYTDKMASIGRLAAGVAHEINNPLAIINEKAGLIKDLFNFKKLYAQDERLMGLVDSIIASVERCATITRRLLSFARHVGGDSKVQKLRIGDIIEEVLGFLHKEADYRSIGITVRVPDQIPDLECDRGRLQQVLLNIVNNAFAAMGDGGQLQVTAAALDRDRVAVTITDNGCGISEADLKRIFEPFFSTKTRKGGTGLGLSITYNLVKELGGEIAVQSELGRGTSFTVILPVRRAGQGAEVHASAAGG